MPATPPLLIVQMGTPPADLRTLLGEQSSWFAAALGEYAKNLRVVRPYLQEALPQESEFSAAIITGSWAMVTDKEDWSVRTTAWAKGLILSGKPLLGVCYGHQLMADAMGGAVGYMPTGRELGTLSVALNESGRADPLFSGLPKAFRAHLTHEQAVLALPPDAKLLGGSVQDPNQILRYGPNAVSIQFHPEFDADILRACIVKREAALVREGVDVATLTSGVVDTPFARQVLLQFVEMYCAANDFAT